MENRRKFHLIIKLVVPLASLWVFGSAVPAFMATRAGTEVSMTADGPALYGSKCAICHGKTGGGTPAWKAKGQPDLSSSEWQKSRSDEQIAERIRSGKGKMPAFGKKLSEEEVSALVRQVRSLRK
jgi:mono/diheme cytochrome c family protein